MGQQSSRKSANPAGCCSCGCVERRVTETSHVQRYVSALTDRWGGRECSCRKRRPVCVCTAYRRVADSCHEDRLAAVLTMGELQLRRDIESIVTMNTDTPLNTENLEQVPGVYVLSVSGGVSLDGEENRNMTLQTNNLTRLQVVCRNDVRTFLLRGPPVPTTKIHTQVDYIHCLVPDLQEITSCSYYWGKMDRYEAERLLDGKPEGTFLLRDSAQEEHLFSVSFRKYGRSLHARIEHYQARFSFDSHDPAVYSANTVTGLVDHYKDPACVMFFEPMLTAPLPRANPFSLQQLSRAVIVSHITYDGVEELPLPSRLRAYLKEYHYRRRVRVRRLDSDGIYLPYQAC